MWTCRHNGEQSKVHVSPFVSFFGRCVMSNPAISRATSIPPGEAIAPLLDQSATELARRIRQGELSSREVVEAHINRTKQVHPFLNAMVRQRFSQARREADEADRRLQDTDPHDLGPLHGVPCTIKESFALNGMPHTSGLLSRRGTLAREDAITVKRLRQAGAIPLGSTNIPELCMWYETHNTVYGRTHNAYSTDHISGGSSGGEGALIGAGCSPFGLGSDIGGSVRMPAYFNGVFGHKTSGGMVPSTGQYPLPPPHAARFLCTGPLCRKAEDLALLTQILMGPDGEDTSCSEMELGDPRQVAIDTMQVFVMEDNGFVSPSAEVRQTLEQAVAWFRTKGASVRKFDHETFARSFDIWGAMLGGHPRTGPSFSQLLGEGLAISTSRELLRWATGRSAHTFPALVLTLVEKLTTLFGSRNQAAIRLGLELREDLSEVLGTRGVLLCPSFPTVVPKHRLPMLSPFHFVYTAIFNVLEMPATQIPMGLGEEGLPLGIQAVARSRNDHLGMAVALELERAFGGWVAPWKVEG